MAMSSSIRIAATSSTPIARASTSLNGTAEGHDAISGQGPFGHVTAKGFTMYDRGDVIVFTGKTNLTLLPRPKDVQ